MSKTWYSVKNTYTSQQVTARDQETKQLKPPTVTCSKKTVWYIYYYITVCNSMPLGKTRYGQSPNKGLKWEKKKQPTKPLFLEITRVARAASRQWGETQQWPSVPRTHHLKCIECHSTVIYPFARINLSWTFLSPTNQAVWVRTGTDGSAAPQSASHFSPLCPPPAHQASGQTWQIV